VYTSRPIAYLRCMSGTDPLTVESMCLSRSSENASVRHTVNVPYARNNICN